MLSIDEAQNTLGADINEIMTGFYALGGTWDGFMNAKEAKALVEQRKSQISPEEYNDQVGRAKVMAQEAIKWANVHGFDGKVIAVWWTARPGVLSTAVGYPVDSRKNPTDVLFKFQDESFLGISAKSTKGSGDIGFKNPGIGSLGASLGVDFKTYIEKLFTDVVKKYKLPFKSNERKAFIRANPKVQEKTRIEGAKVLSTLRDALFNELKKKLNNDTMIKHIKTMWIDAEESLPPYIKVTGHGKNGNYSASIMNPIDNPKILALAAERVAISHVGQSSILVSAGKVPILRMRWKWESEPFGSSIKLSGDPPGGSIHEGGEMLTESNDELVEQVIDLGLARRGELDEIVLTSMGAAIEWTLGRMFSGLSLPLRVKGTKQEIASFANVLGKEKKYVDAFKKSGLDSPVTYQSRFRLEDAVKQFERVTGLRYPFR
jgi:hypothetical protein